MPNSFYLNHRWLLTRVDELERKLRFPLSFSEGVVYEIFLRYKRDIERLNKPNLIKQAAYFAFWIKKLKPIQIVQETPLHINSLLALYCARAIMDYRYELRVSLDENLLHEIIYSLRYRFTSPQSLFLIFQTLYKEKD